MTAQDQQSRAEFEAIYRSDAFQAGIPYGSSKEVAYAVWQAARALPAGDDALLPIAAKSHGAWDGLEELLAVPDGTDIYTAAQVQAMGRVPQEPVWDGLARDIMMWLDCYEGSKKTPRNLFRHLENVGAEIPQWLLDEAEMKALDSVPSKGTRCVILYRAMTESAPRPPAAQEGA